MATELCYVLLCRRSTAKGQSMIARRSSERICGIDCYIVIDSTVQRLQNKTNPITVENNIRQ